MAVMTCKIKGGIRLHLVTGGFAQGKLDWVLAQTGYGTQDVCDGAVCPLDSPITLPVLNRLHLLVRRLVQKQLPVEETVHKMLLPDMEYIIITDEVGMGIVPIDAFEREWREQTGRICCCLAQESALVDRVFAGIATRIKGDGI